MIDFELAVPDGWVQIPTAPDTTRLRQKIINDLIRHRLPDALPRDRAEPWRRLLRKELTAATDEASRQSARSVLLPLQEFNGFKLPGSMLVTVLEQDGDSPAPEQLLASILADAGSDGTYLEIGGNPAVRIASVVDSRRIGRKAPSRRVSYYVANLEAPGAWGLLTFTVLTDGDVDAEPVQAVVLLFDMIVATFRWANRVDAPTESEVIAQLAELEAAASMVGARPTSGHDVKKA